MKKLNLFSFLVLSALLLLPEVISEARPLVLVGCFDGQVYPPALCENYTTELLSLARKGVSSQYGDAIEVRSVGDWSLLLDALTMPNVIGAMISLKEGIFRLSELRQEEFVSSFEKGLGLVGIHGFGYYPCCGKIAREVFPLDANKTASGRIHRNEVITSVHTHRKVVENAATRDAPDLMDIPDSSLIYRYPMPESGWWAPEEGNMTVLYVCTTASRSREVPSVVLYQRGSGVSITYAGLAHTDATGHYNKDPTWYNHSLSIPAVRGLLADSLLYVLKPFAGENSLNVRMNASRTDLEERLAPLREEAELAKRAEQGHRNAALMGTVLIIGVSFVAIVALAYLGFLRGAKAPART